MRPLRKFDFALFLLLFVIGWQVETVHARGFRVGLIPNGPENNCATCHTSPGGGGPRNPFGEDVVGLVPGAGRDAFWDLEFATEDSDKDGVSNGIELGDIDGDGVPERTVNISHPGDGNSVPIMSVGDCNLDTRLDADDLSCVTSIADRDTVLAAIQSLPGDLDGDGKVAFEDFLVLSENFGTDLPAYADGNIDLAGTVDFGDFLVLSSNFGRAAGALSTVPEPGSGLLCLFGASSFLVRRKHRIT